MEEKVFDNEAFIGEYEYKINGLKFKIKPIYLYELIEFENDKLPVCSGCKDDPSDAELLIWWHSIFYKKAEIKTENTQEENKSQNFFIKIKSYIENRKESKTHSKEYASFVIGGKIVAWLEKKVSINGKNIVFHDLENKYRLSKAEIAKMYFYFLEISGFPEPLKEGMHALLATAIKDKI
ncbi:MAG: hypothetical protein HFE57_03610 [Firmicutes bacterium]|jgi:hypothetical protein|nr:hypothetical protein [Bacillota bacterium]